MARFASGTCAGPPRHPAASPFAAMNFLLHRHFAIEELASSPAGIGAMLPDLWRMADRRMRARSSLAVHGHDSPQAQSIQSGVQHHIEADAWFHRTETFVTGEKQLARQLASVGAPKLVLFAHASWEMCLDGALMLEGNFDAIMSGLRADMHEASSSLDHVAALNGADALGANTQFSSRMIRIREGLLAGPWLDSYRSGPGLTQCVDGMRKRFALAPLTAEQRRATEPMMQQALDRASSALPLLLRHRRKHLEERGA